MTEEKKIEDLASDKSTWLEVEDDVHLSIDEIRQEIYRVNNMAVDRDEPALAYVTIMNACLDAQKKLMNAHLDALSKIMAKETQATVEATRKGASEVVEATQQNMKEMVKALSSMTAESLRETARELTSLRTTMKLCTSIMGVSALLVVAVFVLKAMG